ncbi:hypothetical protein V5O48_016993 [Marasmius crinis-equi]|uniref:Uncharacterized protein n=1 Tax=Marasmius crinis-equi TaxID=585013 RepID=A0ABR3EQ79_9AGAR
MSRRHTPSSKGSNSPIPDEDFQSPQTNTPRGGSPGSIRNENFTASMQDPAPLAGLSQRTRDKLPENIIYSTQAAASPIPLRHKPDVESIAQGGTRTQQSDTGRADIGNLTNTVNWPHRSDASSFLVDQSSHTPPGMSSPKVNQPRRTTTVLEMSQMLNKMRTSVKSDFLTVGTNFAIELAKVTTAHESRIEKVLSYVLGIPQEELDKPANTRIPVSPLNSKVSIDPILKQNFETTMQIIDDAINENERGYPHGLLSPVSEPTQMEASTSRVQIPTLPENQLPVSPKPKSPLAARVQDVPDEGDEIVYQGSRHPNQQSTPISKDQNKNDVLTWQDRVTLQRMRNNDRRQFGNSNIPEQGIGFDEDGMPVEKETTPREVWDKQYRERRPDLGPSQHRNTGTHNVPQYNNVNHNHNNRINSAFPQSMRGAAGGNPGDPGDDGSDSDDDRPRPPNKDDGGKRRRTPWGDESSTEGFESEYSTDSLYSDFGGHNSVHGDGNSKPERRRKMERAAQKREKEKLEDFARRRWTKRIHHKYRVQIREQIGRAVPTVDGLKSIKITEPTHYDGGPDVEAFDNWLLNLLRWLIVNKMSGPELDHIRVQITGMLITAKALIWYNDEVASPHRMRTHWSFEDVIIGLFDHCGPNVNSS